MWKGNRFNHSLINLGDFVVSQNILDILKNINNQNIKFKDWKNKKIYKLLCNKELLKLAYNNIKSKPGSMTPGVDAETLDGIDEKYLDDIIKKLKNNTFKFKPSRIKEIPKKDGKTRKISIPSPRDKIVQEAMRLILESIFEPTMSNNSHGFRPGRSCHTALNDIRYKWPGTEWFLEFDLVDFFNSIDHHSLMKKIQEKIIDDKFIQLLRKYLKNGYLENFKYRNSVAGTPQGSTIGPILSNIFLTELDNYIENELKLKYEVGKRKPVNPEYIKIRDIKDKDLRIKEMNKFRREGKIYTKRKTDKYIRIRYIRYADDFLVSLCASKNIAQEIQNKIIEKIESMKLEINEHKTKLVDAYDSVDFLGVQISARKPGKIAITTKNNQKRTIPTGTITIKCVIQKIVQKLEKMGFCNSDGFPICCNKLINFSLEEIVTKFNYILKGLINYYKPTDNFYNFGRIQYILQYSLAKTIAGKLKISMRQVFRKFSKNIKISEKCYFKMEKSFKTTSRWKQADDFSLENYKRTQQMIFIDEVCVCCGSNKDLVKHHIKKIDRKAKSTWDKFMGKINRKQITVCKKCHALIHNGKYDFTPLRTL